jgi:hypothetical protein
MANNYLITGYWGEPHVTAENDRGLNAATFGAGRFVLPVGEQFRAEYIGNNTIRVYDGKLLDNGAAAGIPTGEYVDLQISNAGQGMKRNDLIVFQYSKNSATMIESGTFVVVQGVETSETAADPAITQADILSGSVTLDQMPLYRVIVNGTAISSPVKLFATGDGIAETRTNLTAHAENKSNPHGVTAVQAGAVPNTRKINNKALSSDVTLSASDVGAASASHSHSNYVPTSRTINNKALSSNITLSASDVGAATSGHSHSNYVPTSRTVNGKALSSNITLSASDVSAAASNHGHDYVPTTSGNSSVLYDQFGNVILKKDNYGVAVTDQAFRSIDTGTMYLGNSNYRWITLFAQNACNITSDRNLKENINELDQKYIDLFGKLQPVSYEFIGKEHDRKHIGFISQDVKAAMDEVGLSDVDFAGYCRDVKTVFDEEKQKDVPVLDKDGNPVFNYALRYDEFIALNTKMIQMNKSKIAKQDAKIEAQQTEIDELKKTVAVLTAALERRV